MIDRVSSALHNTTWISRWQANSADPLGMRVSAHSFDTPKFQSEESAMTGIKVLLLLALLANNGFVASASHLQHGHSGKGRTEEPVGSAASAIVEADRRLMSGLEMCYEKFKPDALLSNHRPGKWVTQIWQKDRMFGNLSRDSILLNLPTIPVYDFLDPNQMKR